MSPHRHHPEFRKVYAAWDAMWARCYDSRHEQYKHYGARGITVDSTWKSVDQFIEDLGWPNGLTLERINNDLPYEKSNCRWATQQEQLRNTRRTRLNPELVKQIRADRISGMLYRQLHDKYGISHTRLHDVCSGKTWL